MNVIHSFVEGMIFILLPHKMSFFYSINFLFPVLYVFRRLDQVLCLSAIGTMIVSVRRSSIKVLWCCLYTIVSWEIDADMIVSGHQRRQRIRFKKIVTPQDTFFL